MPSTSAKTELVHDLFGPHPPPIHYFLVMALTLPLCVIALFIAVIILPSFIMLFIISSPSKNERLPSRWRMSTLKLIVLNIILYLKSVDGSSSSPPKKASKPHEFASPVRTDNGDNVDIDNLTHSLGRSPFLGGGDINYDNNNDSSDDDSVDELKKEVNKLFGGWVNRNVITVLNNFLITDDSDLKGIRLATKNYLIALLVNNDARNLRKTFKKRQSKLNKIIKSLKLGKYVVKSRKDEDNNSGDLENWLSNLGEFLNDSTEGLVMANYSPVNDCSLQDDGYCRIPRNNPCMIKFCRSLINSLISELDRFLTGTVGSSSDIYHFPHDDNVGHTGVRLVDACSIVLGKTDYLGEIKKFIQVAGYLNKYEFYAVSVITIGFHAKYFSLINEGKLLPILPATANGRDNLLDYDNIAFDEDGVFESCYCKLFRCVPHGECWSNKTYLLQYSYESMIEIGRSLVGFYSCFEGIGNNKNLSKLSQLKNIVDATLTEELGLEVKGSVIGFRYSGIAFMTPEEREELIKCRLFFFKSGTLSSFLFGGEGKNKTRDDMKDGSEMALLFDEMLQFHNKKYEQEDDTTMFMKKLKAKYDSMVLGGEKGGRWSTLASAFAATSPPWCHSALNNAMKNLFVELLGDGDLEDFCHRLRERYNSLQEGGRTCFVNRVGCFKWIDDFSSLFQRILESGGDEGGVMVSSSEMERFEQLSHVLRVAPLISQIDTTTIAASQINEMASRTMSTALYNQALNLITSSANVRELYQTIYDELNIGLDDRDGVLERYRALLKRMEQYSGIKVKVQTLRLTYNIKIFEHTRNKLTGQGVKKVNSNWGDDIE